MVRSGRNRIQFLLRDSADEIFQWFHKLIAHSQLLISGEARRSQQSLSEAKLRAKRRTLQIAKRADDGGRGGRK